MHLQVIASVLAKTPMELHTYGKAILASTVVSANIGTGNPMQSSTFGSSLHFTVSDDLGFIFRSNCITGQLTGLPHRSNFYSNDKSVSVRAGFRVGVAWCRYDIH